jgi:hypothetical protein
MLRSTRALLLALAACGAPSTGDDDGTAGTTTVAAPTSTEPDATTTTTPTSTTAGTTDATTGDAVACDDSPQALADCVDPQRWEDDINFVADIRDPGTPHWQAVQDLCADRLAEAGYQVELQNYGTGVNVVGRRPGATLPDEQVLVTAHYDHIPDCLGADDNASGVAAALEVARVLALAEYDRTLIVACWDEEEDGLIGSEAYAAAAVAAGDNIVGIFNYDMIGFYDAKENAQTVPAGFDLAFPDAYAELEANNFKGDFVGVIADSDSHAAVTAFAAAADRVGLRRALLELPAGTETSDVFGDLRRSDHAAFWDAGYPAIFVTDSGEFRNANYHCMAGPDEVSDLNADFAVNVTRATVEASAVVLGL